MIKLTIVIGHRSMVIKSGRERGARKGFVISGNIEYYILYEKGAKLGKRRDMLNWLVLNDAIERGFRALEVKVWR